MFLNYLIKVLTLNYTDFNVLIYFFQSTHQREIISGGIWRPGSDSPVLSSTEKVTVKTNLTEI